MSEKNDKKKRKKTESEEIDKFLELARKRLKREQQIDKDNRTDAVEDLKFRHGEGHWTTDQMSRRKAWGGSTLTVNLLPSFIDQVTGEMRQLRPRADISPVDSKGTPEIAKVRKGIIWDIEYKSEAEVIYDYSGEMMTTCGYGAWMIKTKDSDENPFLEEIQMELIQNPFVVFLEQRKSIVFADSRYGFIIDKVPKDEFEETYPDAKIPESSRIAIDAGLNLADWYDAESVIVAEYYILEPEEKEYVLLKDGSFLLVKDYEETLEEWEEINRKYQISKQNLSQKLREQIAQTMQAQQQQMPPQGTVPPGQPAGQPNQPSPQQQSMPSPEKIEATIAQTVEKMLPPIPDKPEIAKDEKTQKEKRKIVPVNKVKKYLITGTEILNKTGLSGDDVPGEYIPIVLLKGREYNIEGKRKVKGLIRDAKDPQRLVDYWISACADSIALAPKSEWIGTAEQFEGYEQDFLEANNKNLPMLKYNPHNFQGQLVPPPGRVSPAPAPEALFTQINLSQEQLKAVIGMKNIDLKDNGREISGIAQARKQRPADLSTFVFHDNLARAIIHSGKIINSMIPDVYDSERDVRVRNYDDSQSFIPINTSVEHALKLATENPTRYTDVNIEELRKRVKKREGGMKYNDIGIGRYGLVVSTTPSYATQRQESTDLMGKLIQTNPKLMNLFGDIFVRGLDILFSDEIADRLEKTLPPGLVPLKEGEEPPKPLPPSPQVQAMMSKAKAAEIGAQVKVQELGIASQKLKLESLKIIKEMQNSKEGIKKEVLDILSQVLGTSHPADKALMQPMPPVQPQGQPQEIENAGA